jgi:HTH-type transcriptional regulator, glycine betaine synthesis regulator
MDEELNQARDHFIQGMSRVTHFWGFPKAMGAIYGAIYLSPTAVSLDELVEQVGVSKGAISTNVRMLERLNMVHRQVQVGDRKDYYTAEVDFWKVMKSIMQEREKNEFALALRTVGESLDMVNLAESSPESVEMTVFYQERLRSMKGFFDQLDSLVAMLISLDGIRLNALMRFFGNSKSG